MRVLILAHGDSPSSALAQRLHGEHDLLLATDGAAHRAAGLHLTPDIICGDFDSVRLDVAQAEFPRARLISTPDQEQADLEKAVSLARDLGATAITIIGATGGRMDHTLGNLALLLRLPVDLSVCLADDLGTVRALHGTQEEPGAWTFAAEAGDTVSLICFESEVRVSVEGVQWPLERSPLTPGTRGVSNVALEDRVTVRVWGGGVFVCHLAQASLAERSRLPEL